MNCKGMLGWLVSVLKFNWVESGLTLPLSSATKSCQLVRFRLTTRFQAQTSIKTSSTTLDGSSNPKPQPEKLCCTLPRGKFINIFGVVFRQNFSNNLDSTCSEIAERNGKKNESWDFEAEFNLFQFIPLSHPHPRVKEKSLTKGEVLEKLIFNHEKIDSDYSFIIPSSKHWKGPRYMALVDFCWQINFSAWELSRRTKGGLRATSFHAEM